MSVEADKTSKRIAGDVIKGTTREVARPEMAAASEIWDKKPQNQRRRCFN